MTKLNTLLTGLFISLATLAQAQTQDTGRLDSTYQLININYTPTLSDAIKIGTIPSPEVPKSTKPEFTYALPVHSYPVQAVIKPEAPILLKPSKPVQYYGNYFKFGFGNYSSPLFEAHVSTTRNEDYLFGLNYKHASSNASSPKYADYSDNKVEVYGKRMYRKGTFSGMMDYTRNQRYFYGYDENKLEVTDRDSIGQTFSNIQVGALYEKAIKDSGAFRYNLGTDFYAFSNSTLYNETNIGVNSYMGKEIGKRDLLFADIKYNYNSLEDSVNTYSRNFIVTNPRYRFYPVKPVVAEIGLNTTYFMDSANKNEFYINPVIKGDYHIVHDELVAFAEFSGEYQQNRFRTFAQTNPFLSDSFGLVNTYNSAKFLVGIRGKLSPKTDFNIQLSNNKYNDMPLYIADSGEITKFLILYEDMSVLNAKAQINYHYGKKLELALVTNLYSYNLDTEKKPWQLPTFTYRFSAKYNMSDKILLSADVFGMDRRFQRVAFDPSGATKEISGYVDFNLAVDYRWRKNWSVFAKFNNIGSKRYQQWYNYKVYGFNALAGIAFNI